VKKPEALTLAEFTVWANRRVFNKAARLPRSTLGAPARLSYPSPLATLIHILDTQWYWRVAAQSGVVPLETLTPADFPALASLRRRWDEEDRALVAFIQGLSGASLAGKVRYRWPRARPRSRPLAHILLHIANHSTQHRSELATFLTSRSLSPGNLDFIRFAARKKS
jgi:uncharacterized damage-inducible protein DinB